MVPKVGLQTDSREPGVRVVSGGDGPRLKLSGDWNLLALHGRQRELDSALARHALDPDLCWDLREVGSLDNVGAAFILNALSGRGVEQLELRPEHRELFQGLQAAPPIQLPRRRWSLAAPVEALGRAAFGFRGHFVDAVRLSGQLVLDAIFLVRHPGSIPWREISASVYRTGAMALPITALVGFLIGVVLSYLLARQLRRYGADVFLVNLLGISILRELGPMLAAILVAGRSGSAMTAQLGVMRLTQELDALSVMGISHTQRLVLSKVLALSVALPLIVLWTNAIALLGGMAAASIQLDFSFRSFIAGLPAAVPVANLWLGLVKGVVFGALIAFLACHFGLRIQPNTESLGEGTTTSVVTAITIVIFVDAIFAVAFSKVGLY
jgi:phospholipid/cholesterol/gamma-HCH transport system permease protein